MKVMFSFTLPNGSQSHQIGGAWIPYWILLDLIAGKLLEKKLGITVDFLDEATQLRFLSLGVAEGLGFSAERQDNGKSTITSHQEVTGLFECGCLFCVAAR